MTSQQHHAETRYRTVGTETAEVRLWLPTVFVLSMIALIALALAVTWGLYTVWSGPATLSRQQARPHVPKVSRPMNAAPLSARQMQERAEYEARQQHLHTTYGWIDRRAGIVRIPLEQAIQRQLRSGGTAP